MEDYFSEITKFFTPSSPIQKEKNLFGREREKSLLYKSILAPGRQSCVYGERGVGKTSLVNVVTNYMSKKHKFITIRHACSKYDTFEKILLTLFLKTGKDKYITEQKEKENLTAGAKIKIPIAEIGGGATSESEKNYKSFLNIEINPQLVETIFENEKVIFIIDEFDRIQDDNVLFYIAETIKTLSDSNSTLKLIISGVSHNTIDLIGNHPSIKRNINPIKVKRMEDADLEKIINHGEKFLNLNFEDIVKQLIIHLSNGLPYFTHLLSENLADSAFFNNEFNIGIQNFINNVSYIVGNEVFEDSNKKILSNIKINNSSHTKMIDVGQELFIEVSEQNIEVNYAKKIVLFSSSLLSTINQDNLISFINYLKSVESNLDLNTIGNIHIIFAIEELSFSSDILVQINDKYYFKDSFLKTFTFLKAMEFFKENKVPNTVYKTFGKKY